MTNVAKSENSDEFLKRNNLQGYDESILDSKQNPKIDISDIPAINQPKEKGSATPCNKCEDQ